MIDKWDIYTDALNFYGIESQKAMLVEEVGELLNALAKFRRERATGRDVITELADVSIMVEQMAVVFGKEQYEREKERKLERLKYRLTDKKDKLPYDETQMFDGNYRFK